MGTLVRVTVETPEQALAEKALAAARRRFEELNNILSDWKPDSELNRLCRNAPGVPVRVSRELFAAVAFGQRLAVLTGGVFDVTIGARTRGRMGTVGYQYLSLGAGTITLQRPGMQLDLGALGKGYAGDEAGRAMRDLGVERFLIAASGDIVAGKAPEGQAGWRVGVAGGWRMLVERGVSTAGDENQPGHILDATTGQSVRGRRNVSVIGPDGLTADGLDTALYLLPRERWKELLASFPQVEVVEG